MSKIETLEEYIKRLREEADDIEKAVNEKYKGDWNYPFHVRQQMHAEKRLLRKIADELEQFSGFGARPVIVSGYCPDCGTLLECSDMEEGPAHYCSKCDKRIPLNFYPINKYNFPKSPDEA